MRRVVPVLVAVAAIALGGCGGSGSSASTSPSASEVSPVPTSSATSITPGQDMAGLDAAGVVTWLADRDVPITVAQVYDENTDPNNRLGRPGGYTSKAAFADSRVPKSKYGSEVDDPHRGGSVEVFADEAAAVARSKEVQTKLKAFGLGTEYDYVVDGVLVRVSGSVTPSQAASYAKALGVEAQPAA